MSSPKEFAANEIDPDAVPRKNPFLAFTEWLPLVNRQTMGKDLTAGITGALVVLPQGVAFATLAGMPPEYGLYAGMIPAIIAALFGSSWHLVSGPTTAASLLIFASISAFATPGTPEFVSLVLTLTLMVGALELFMGLMRMGALVNFISHTVAIGFTAGAAILIMVSQMEGLLGLDVPRGRHFYDTLGYLWDDRDGVSPAAAFVGVSAIVLGIASKRLFPNFPNMILALVGSCLIALVMNTYFDAGVATLSAIPSGLPPLSAPNFSADVIRDLAPTAVAVTIFALTEAMSISRAIAIRSGQHIDGNQEFIGQGLSNLVGCFFSSYVATGSFNRSGLNFESGAKTPIAAISAGVFLMGIVILVAPLVVYLPKAGMAGILILVGVNLIDVKHIKQVIRSSRSEASVLAVTFFSVLFLDLELAIFAGVILSLVFYLNRTSHPNVAVMAPNNVDDRRRLSEVRDQPECPQLKIVRIDGAMYFGAVSSVIEDLHRLESKFPDQRHMVVLCSGIHFIDVTGAEALASEAAALRKAGGALYLVGLRGRVLEQLRKSGVEEEIGKENIFQSKTVGFATIYQRLNQDICGSCTQRIFWECREQEDRPAPILPAMPPIATQPSRAPAPAVQDKPAIKPAPRSGPRRILVLIDLERYPTETLQMAADLAKENGAELAVGSLIKWQMEHGHSLALNVVSDDLIASLRAPAQARLQGMAEDAGFPDCATLHSTKQDAGAATLDMVTDWHPDLLVIADRSGFDLELGSHVSYRTPSGRAEVDIVRYKHSRKKNGK